MENPRELTSDNFARPYLTEAGTALNRYVALTMCELMKGSPECRYLLAFRFVNNRDLFVTSPFAQEILPILINGINESVNSLSTHGENQSGGSRWLVPEGVAFIRFAKHPDLSLEIFESLCNIIGEITSLAGEDTELLLEECVDLYHATTQVAEDDAVQSLAGGGLKSVIVEGLLKPFADYRETGCRSTLAYYARSLVFPENVPSSVKHLALDQIERMLIDEASYSEALKSPYVEFSEIFKIMKEFAGADLGPVQAFPGESEKDVINSRIAVLGIDHLPYDQLLEEPGLFASKDPATRKKLLDRWVAPTDFKNLPTIIKKIIEVAANYEPSEEVRLVAKLYIASDHRYSPHRSNKTTDKLLSDAHEVLINPKSTVAEVSSAACVLSSFSIDPGSGLQDEILKGFCNSLRRNDIPVDVKLNILEGINLKLAHPKGLDFFGKNDPLPDTHDTNERWESPSLADYLTTLFKDHKDSPSPLQDYLKVEALKTSSKARDTDMYLVVQKNFKGILRSSHNPDLTAPALVAALCELSTRYMNRYKYPVNMRQKFRTSWENNRLLNNAKEFWSHISGESFSDEVKASAIHYLGKYEPNKATKLAIGMSKNPTLSSDSKLSLIQGIERKWS